MEKVKVFSGYAWKGHPFEKEINEWLETHNVEIIRVLQSGDELTTIIIFYKEIN